MDIASWLSSIDSIATECAFRKLRCSKCQSIEETLLPNYLFILHCKLANIVRITRGKFEAKIIFIHFSLVHKALRKWFFFWRFITLLIHFHKNAHCMGLYLINMNWPCAKLAPFCNLFENELKRWWGITKGYQIELNWFWIDFCIFIYSSGTKENYCENISNGKKSHLGAFKTLKQHKMCANKWMLVVTHLKQSEAETLSITPRYNTLI